VHHAGASTSASKRFTGFTLKPHPTAGTDVIFTLLNSVHCWMQQAAALFEASFKDLTMIDLMTNVLRNADGAPRALSASSLIVDLNIQAAKHIYTELNAGEIRIIRLHPAAELQDCLHCSLETVLLSQKPQYEALSYVWGDQNDHRTIHLSAHEFKVTRNLDLALRYLRRPDSERLLWVDALTINQSDTAEKNTQVWEMANIYHSAASTIVWLGEGDRNIQTLFIYVSGFKVPWDKFESVKLEIIDISVAGLLGLTNLFDSIDMLPYWSRA
jgi:hypothetical protein